MIEYASARVIKLLKQYNMLSKSLKFTVDIKQKNDICNQMTKIIESVLDETNNVYREKYNLVLNRSVYLMDEEKSRLLELINLINERITYVNNQITTNEELTGMRIVAGNVYGEENINKYKQQVKLIDKYKNNIRLEKTLEDELSKIELEIKKLGNKINNNQVLNRRLENGMISLVDKALNKLSLYDLRNEEKEIDLLFTELGYSLEKAKENAKVAKQDYSEDIVMECENMLSSITIDYDKCKEKKLILKLIDIFDNKVNDYDELLKKREKINDILINIQNSKLYAIIGNELNKEYATIKLEAQDLANLKNLMGEKEVKSQKLVKIREENDSDELKTMLAGLLENEKKHQEVLEKERQKQEELRQEKIKELKKQKQEEYAKKQKLLEEERKKEIEERTKQLLVEKKNPILNSNKEQNNTVLKDNKVDDSKKKKTIRSEVLHKSDELFTRKTDDIKKDDIFSREKINNSVVDKGIPVIKNNNSIHDVIEAKKKEKKAEKVFPDIPLDKKKEIFPSFPEIKDGNDSSFFDDDEFKELNNFMEDDQKKSWF